MSAKKSSPSFDPVEEAIEDGSYSQLATPLNVPKSEPDPQADYENSVIPHASADDSYDPMGYLDLTGPRGRRGDPGGVKGKRS